MRKLKVCLYGGTNLDGVDPMFVETLAQTILSRLHAIIVVGGFKQRADKPSARTTDMAALEGARHHAALSGIPVSDCCEAWLPDPRLDGRPDVQGVVRMTAADGPRIRVVEGRTALGRRLAMVADVDVVVTISGKVHTEVVVEQALEIGVPVFPIPSAGGDSKDLLTRYEERIAKRFDTGAVQRCVDELQATYGRSVQAAADAVVALIQQAHVGRCLVLMPFDDEHKARYDQFIGPAIERRMTAVRLDLLPSSSDIVKNFEAEMTRASAVIVDATKSNENVMYEIGYAQALGYDPLLVVRDAERPNTGPMYLRTKNLKVLSDDGEWPALIDAYLLARKTAVRLEK